jgi:hypothetical protein
LDYIREYVDIVINMKVETTLKSIKFDKNNGYTNQIEKYELLIQKLEDEIRSHVKVINFNNRLKMK